MPPKKELCRNFQRGSCRYGDKCRFLHSTQQQTKPNNPFGFGAQNSSNFQSSTAQQPTPNPFGFGVQSAPQQNGGSNFGASNSFKPFENKWTRNSSATGGISNASQQNQNQSQGSNHKCTDPNDCKKLIAADFEDEKPLWKLTCYGHFKHLPCDITGDTSYEELRAAAYEDAKRGTPLQSIVERERSLQQSKHAEFESLLRNPYTKLQNSAQSLQNPFPSTASNSLSLAAQKPSPSPFSSFGQPITATQNPNPSPFASFGQPTTIAQNSSPTPFSSFGQPSTAMQNPSPSPFSSFGQPSTAMQTPSPSPFSSFGQPATSFGISTSTSSSKPPSNPFGFGQINNSSQPSTTSGPSSVTSANPGGGGPFSAFSTQTPRFSNSGMSNLTDSKPPTSLFPQNVNSTTNLLPGLSNDSGAHGNGFGQMASVTQSLVNMPKESSAVDASIWLKEVWKLGEIPEDIPPVEYIR